MNKNSINEIIGWYGAGAIILAYALVSSSLVSATGLVYQLLNLTGAFGIIWISYRRRVYQSVALNVVWSIIALVAILRLVL
tara:strand:- start:163 stop:405 length:243 start_codon:yes stop_codon:yes gene_type:complete